MTRPSSSGAGSSTRKASARRASSRWRSSRRGPSSRRSQRPADSPSRSRPCATLQFKRDVTRSALSRVNLSRAEPPTGRSRGTGHFLGAESGTAPPGGDAFAGRRGHVGAGRGDERRVRRAGKGGSPGGPMKARARRILLAEDSPIQAEWIRFLLEGEGYEVQLAGNGREGLAAVSARAPDLIISDVGMPEMDGFAF